MTYKQVATMISTIGLPYAYDHFTDNTERQPPFVCFIFPESDDFAAENKNYVKIRRLQIELYTDNKDFVLESQVEAVLEANGLPYETEGAYLNDELMYMQTYTTEILIDTTTTIPTTEGASTS